MWSGGFLSSATTARFVNELPFLRILAAFALDDVLVPNSLAEARGSRTRR